MQNSGQSHTPLLQLQLVPNLVDRVYQALVDAISSGTLASGTRLLQDDIAAKLAVSRQPVLQALRLLKSEGLVLDAPGRGVLVAPLDVAGVAHAYQVRGALDALAARLAAEHHAVIHPAVL
ncbi:MAG: GntR family transcriptional regulator, partial [Chitinophagaceae bacterium]|nr:GntR family transcriptional regulator [Rubrivivax sp.]